MALSKGHTFTSGEVVTPTKLNNLVDNATIGDGTISTAMIADDAVTADKIATGAVTSDALASGVGGASAINDLTDVDTSSVAPTDGQALVWDNANSQWEPGTVSGGGTVTYLSSPSTLLDVSGLSAQANNNTYVTYTIPSSVPSTAGSVVLRVITSADEDEVTVHAKTSSWSERKVGWSYGPNNADDASGDVNTFLIPYSSTVDIKYNGTGSGSAEIAQVYVDGYMTGGSSSSSVSSYSSGWATSHGSTTVADGALLTITHNLGTTDVVMKAYVNSSASDTNAQDIDSSIHNDGGVFHTGAQIVSLSSNSIDIRLGSNGYNDMASSGGFNTTSYASKYVKVVVIG